MYLLIFGLMLVSNCMGDPVLESLYGVHGGNRVTACVHGERARACPAAVWMDHWAVIRETCVGPEDTILISIWKLDVNCSEALSGKIKDMPCNVMGRYHQQHRTTDDLVLLHLDRPYFNTDPLDNRSVNSDIVKKLKLWVGTINEHTTRSAFMKNQVVYYNRRYMDMYTSPIKMFVATVILPSTTFMLFFLFVIFCTGSSKSKIQYKNLTNEKEESDSTNV